MKKNILLILLINICFGLQAQWKHIDNKVSESFRFVEINENYNTVLYGSYNIYLTSNKVDTLSRIYTTDIWSGLIYNAATILDKSKFIIVGGGVSNYIASINFTKDQGKTWTETYHKTAGMLRDVEQNDKGTIITVGDNGTILRSTNEGVNWTPIYVNKGNLFTVTYNQINGKWIIGGVGQKLTSYDDGLTWSQEQKSGNITKLQYQEGKIIETFTPTSSNTKSIIYNENGTIQKEFIQENASAISLLINKNLFSFGSTFITFHDPVNSNYYVTTDSIYGMVYKRRMDIYDVAVGSTFSVAIGLDGSIARYDFTDKLNFYVPASFYIDNYALCPNELIQITPKYTYADSYTWKIDGKVVSNNTILNYPQPASPTNHKIELTTTSYGISNTYSSSTYIPQKAKSVNLKVIALDTFVCYNSNAHFFIDSLPFDFTTLKYRVIKNKNQVSPLKSFKSSSAFSDTTGFLTISDTVTIEILSIGQCDTVFKKFNFYIKVGPNLGAFQISSIDTNVCNTINPISIQLNNTIKNAIYEFKYGYFQKKNWNPTTSINSYLLKTDTARSNSLLTTFPANSFIFNNINLVNIGDTLYEDTTVIHRIGLKVSYGTCQFSSNNLKRIYVANTTAQITAYSSVTLIGDTLKLNSKKACDNYSWTISPKVKYQGQNNQRFNYYVLDSLIDYTIQLKVNSKYGCSDSINLVQQIAQQITIDSLSGVCFSNKIPQNLSVGNGNYSNVPIKIVDSKISIKGNIHNYGYMSRGSFSGFMLQKLSPSGKIIWEKRHIPDLLQQGDRLILSIDIDDNENIYAIILANKVINFELIKYQDYYKPACFLVKWDSLGKMINYTKLPNTYMDIAFKNNKIYLANLNNFDIYDLNFKLFKSNFINGYNYREDESFWHSDGVMWNPRRVRINPSNNGKILFSSYYPFKNIV
jgi:hypothetical protein